MRVLIGDEQLEQREVKQRELICANPEHRVAAERRASMGLRDRRWAGTHASIPAHDYCIVPRDEAEPELIDGRPALCPLGVAAPDHVWVDAPPDSSASGSRPR